MNLWASLVAKVGKVAAIAIAVLVGALIIWGLIQVRSCQNGAGADMQAKVNSGQLGAYQNSAGDASNTIANEARSTAESEDLTRSNEREIRNAQGANAPVDPAARDAGLHALCRRPAYRDTERCRLLNAAPR